MLDWVFSLGNTKSFYMQISQRSNCLVLLSPQNVAKSIRKIESPYASHGSSVKNMKNRTCIIQGNPISVAERIVKQTTIVSHFPRILVVCLSPPPLLYFSFPLILSLLSSHCSLSVYASFYIIFIIDVAFKL